MGNAALIWEDFTMFKNLSVATRLGGGIAFITLSLCALILFALNTFRIEHEGLSHLHEKLIPATSFLYSSDRDLQQALVAERSLLLAEPGSETFKSFLADYEENVTQARDRVESFLALVEDEQISRLQAQYEGRRREW